MRVIKDLAGYKKEREQIINDIETMKLNVTYYKVLIIGEDAYNKMLNVFYLDLIIYKDKLKALESILNLNIIVNPNIPYFHTFFNKVESK